MRPVRMAGVQHEPRAFPPERPKRPDKNLQALCRATQLTKDELKKFYRAFKQVRDREKSSPVSPSARRPGAVRLFITAGASIARRP